MIFITSCLHNDDMHTIVTIRQQPYKPIADKFEKVYIVKPPNSKEDIR